MDIAVSVSSTARGKDSEAPGGAARRAAGVVGLMPAGGRSRCGSTRAGHREPPIGASGSRTAERRHPGCGASLSEKQLDGVAAAAAGVSSGRKKGEE